MTQNLPAPLNSWWGWGENVLAFGFPEAKGLEKGGTNCILGCVEKNVLAVFSFWSFCQDACLRQLLNLPRLCLVHPFHSYHINRGSRALSFTMSLLKGRKSCKNYSQDNAGKKGRAWSLLSRIGKRQLNGNSRKEDNYLCFREDLHTR